MTTIFRLAFAECILVLFHAAAGFGRGDGLVRDVLPTKTLDIVTVIDDVATSGQCTCRTEWPSVVTCTDYIVPDYSERLEEAETEIARLRRQLSAYDDTVIALHIDLEIVGSQLNMTQGTLEGVLDGTVVLTVDELELVQEELKELSLILERVELVVTDVPEVQLLREELDNFTRIIADLQLSNPTEARVLRKKINELKSKLAECEQYYTSDIDDGLFQPWNVYPSQDSCSDIIRVSEPFTVRGRGTRSGAWFRDPIQDYAMVWYAPFHNPRLTFQVDRFANVADFTRGTRYESRYSLPTGLPSQGPGMVAFNGSLYYNADRSSQIIRFDIESRVVAATGDLPDALINNGGAYTAEGYTDIDLAVDEFGLWAIYTPTYDDSITITSQLDPGTLDTIATYTAPFPKYSAGNCFMICAKLYCTSSHFSHDATVEFVYDTDTDVFKVLEIPFDNRFGQMMSLDYNPRDQKLYGWDNGHQVIYDLTFDPKDMEADYTTSDSEETEADYATSDPEEANFTTKVLPELDLQ